MIYTIYLHKNKINGKVYIGQTKQYPPEKRWKNGLGYKNCTHFYKAIQKYGWDNFQHIILEQKEMSPQDADNKEDYYIKLFNSQNQLYGYNITSGGYKTISPKANIEAIKWMKNNPGFGLARAQDMLRWQKEHPEEMALMRKENQKKATEARKKAVICVETGIIYESASQAARENPTATQSKICMVCRGQRKTCGGYHWKYV